MNSKKNFSLFSILIILTFLFGCFGSSTDLTDNTNNTGPTTVITGSLYTGTISSSSVKTSSTGIKKMATAGQPEGGSTIVAIKDTGETFISETDAQGNFEISVEPGTYYLEIIDDGKDMGPITVGLSSDNKPIMAIEVNATADIGIAVHEEAKHCSALVNEPTALLDETTEARGEGLVPVGAENYGKGDAAKVIVAVVALNDSGDEDKMENDKDGKTNFFDADNDGNGIIDELDGQEDNASSSNGVNAWFFENLKVQHNERNTYKNEYLAFNIALGIEAFTPKQNSLGTFAAKTIASVFVVDGPAWLEKATVNNTFGPGQQSSTLFKDQNYEIKYNDQMGRHEVFLGEIKPITDINAGDVLTIKVTFTDNSIVYILKMINAVFTEIPLLSAYSLDGGITYIDVPLTDISNPITQTNTKLLYLRWFRPKDENGNEIIGGRYTWEYLNSGSGAGEVEVVNSDSGVQPYVEGHYDMSTLSNMVLGGPQNNEIMVGICLRSSGNDNAAENINLTYTTP